MDLFVPVDDVAFDELGVSIRILVRDVLPGTGSIAWGIAYGASSLATCSPRSTFRSAIVTKALSPALLVFAWLGGVWLKEWMYPAAANSRTVVSPMPLAPIDWSEISLIMFEDNVHTPGYDDALPLELARVRWDRAVHRAGILVRREVGHIVN